MERKLLFATAVDVALVDVERTVFLAQVVVGVVVACPYGCSVFAVEVGQLAIVALAVKPKCRVLRANGGVYGSCLRSLLHRDRECRHCF